MKQSFICLIFISTFFMSTTDLFSMELPHKKQRRDDRYCKKDEDPKGFWIDQSQTAAQSLTQALIEHNLGAFCLPDSPDVRLCSLRNNKMFSGRLSGGSQSLGIHHFCSVGPAKKPEILSKLLDEYKIHLMPRDEDVEKAVLHLVDTIESDEGLCQAIAHIKIKTLLEPLMPFLKKDCSDFTFPRSQMWRLPKIIIYVQGKQKAQTALDKLHQYFAGWPYVDRVPAFNEKVTGFLSFAQGNRDDKVLKPDYFEWPGLVYYRSDITGNREDYHLINPATKK